MNKNKILLSKENPTGHKLEELLQQVITDVEQKSEAVSVQFDGTSPQQCLKTDVMCHVLENNHTVVKALRTALKAQIDTLEQLKRLGPDQGVHGKARL